MTYQIKRNGIFCFFTFLSITSFSQVVVTDTALHTPAALTAVSVYQNAMLTQLPLYNGPEYNFANPHILGLPFFNENNDWHIGSVAYEGVTYQNVPLRYDIYKNEAVILHYNGVSPLYLIQDKVERFGWDNNNFINIKTGQAAAANLTPGYYRAIYTGPSKILGKYKVELQSVVGNIGSLTAGEFRHIKRYNVWVDNAYVEFKTAKDLLSILKNKRKELRQYVKTNGINLKENPEEAMAILATEYDRINK